MHSPGRTTRGSQEELDRFCQPTLFCRLGEWKSAPREPKTGVRMSRVHFKIWGAQGPAPLLRQNPIPPADATLQPAWTTLATVVSLKEEAMFQEHLESGLCFVPGDPFLSAFAGGSASHVTHRSLCSGPTNCGAVGARTEAA